MTLPVEVRPLATTRGPRRSSGWLEPDRFNYLGRPLDGVAHILLRQPVLAADLLGYAGRHDHMTDVDHEVELATGVADGGSGCAARR